MPRASVLFDQSYILVTATPTASALNFNHFVANAWAAIAQIVLRDEKGIELSNTNRLPEAQICMRALRTMSSSMTKDKYIATGIQFCPMFACDLLTSANFRIGIPTASNSTRNYVTERYLVSATASNSATPVLNLKFSFRDLAGICALGSSKVMPLIHNSYLYVYWNPYMKWGLSSTSATSTSGVDTTPSALTTSIALTNISLMLAINQNVIVENALKTKISSGGLDCLVPHTETVFRTFSASTNQATNYDLNVGLYGRRLTRVFFTIFDSTESADTLYDCSTRGTSANLYTDRVQTIYSTLNSARRQDRNETPDQVYESISHLLKDSVIADRDNFLYQFAWVDDFSGLDKICDVEPLYERELGLDLSSNPTYAINCTTASIADTHHMFAQCQRVIRITPQGYIVL
jgi:hypothetical protein